MKRNLTLFLCLFIVFLFNRNIYAAAYYPGKVSAKKETNLLLITIDTLRADRLSCYGPDILETPHIDTLAEHLAEQGFATGAFVGAYPLDSRYVLAQGFTTYDDEYTRHHKDNFYSPEPFKSRFAETPYDGEVAYVDQEMGRLFKYLESQNLIENTVIVFTGDHGEALGDHGEETHAFFAYNSTLWKKHYRWILTTADHFLIWGWPILNSRNSGRHTHISPVIKSFTIFFSQRN